MNYSEEKFLRRIEEEFTEIPAGSLTPSSELAKILNWNSMNVLLFLAMIMEDTGVRTSFDEVRQFDTLHNLYQFITSKTA